jgi:PAP2 superfamily
LANAILNFSEPYTLRYFLYLLYLNGDPILATKTALVGFFGQFILVMMKIAYKEPRPFWVSKDITSFRCSSASDFEGPSDHMFILMFLGTYSNLIYLRKYAPEPRKITSAILFIFKIALMLGTVWAGLILGHTYAS